MMLKDFDIFLAFVFGSIIGSFLNVCIHRIPKRESVIFPPSYCPNCLKQIKWYDNIPVLSYLFLMGRCGSCRIRIPPRYLAVEIITGAMVAAFYAVFGLHLKFFAYSALVCALITASTIDLVSGEIPHEITAGGIATGLVLSFAFPGLLAAASRLAGLEASALGIAAGGGSIFAMGIIGSLIFRKAAMGFGDVMLMAMIGSFIGWKLALLAFFIAPFFGAVVGIAAKIARGDENIPYGPHLSLAAVVSIFFGDRIIGVFFGGM